MIDINFEFPILLIFIFPSIIFLFWYWRTEYILINKITKYIHYTKINKITSWISTTKDGVLNHKKFYYYALGCSLSFLSLLIALANPLGGEKSSELYSEKYGIYLLIDSSYSMRVEDPGKGSDYEYIPTNRNWEARIHALSLIKRCPDLRFGIYSFGETSLRHTGPDNQYNWLHSILYRDLNVFDSKYSGTSYVTVLEDILESLKYEDSSFGIVLYSDGDVPESEFERLGELLETFKNLKIPIHVIAVGSPGEKEVTYEFNILNLEDRSGNTGDAAGRTYVSQSSEVVKKVNVKFDEEILKKIADETGGYYHATYTGSTGIDELSKIIREKENSASFHPFFMGQRNSLSRYFLLVPFLFYIYDFYLRNGFSLFQKLFNLRNRE